MPLDPEKIKHLMAVKNRPKIRKTRKSGPDTSIRTVDTWFALQHRFMDNDTKELLHCENPNCQDPRQKGIMVVDINGTYMCRYCFLDGWLTNDSEQEQLNVG